MSKNRFPRVNILENIYIAKILIIKLLIISFLINVFATLFSLLIAAACLNVGSILKNYAIYTVDCSLLCQGVYFEY